MLFNNILYCFSDIYIISYILDFIIGKLDGLLKAIEDKDGKVDIEGILSESIDNLVVAQVKKYPLDNKIIESAITFYFKDEDSGSTKTWNYFKTAN